MSGASPAMGRLPILSREPRDGRAVARLTIVYWRDIPAQVIVKAGRRAAKRPLADRFQQAIDRAAMRARLSDSESYLAEWRRGAPSACADDIERAADDAASRIEQAYDDGRLAALVRAGGYDGDKE